MSIGATFQYAKPKKVSEVLKLLAKTKGAVVLAGGTDVVGALKEGAITPPLLVDIKGLEELSRIEVKGEALRVGALVTFAEILESKLIQSKFPVLAEIAGKVASVGVRNRATLVGNICSAVPCLDSGPVLVAMGGFVHTRGVRGGRKIPAEKWFVHSRKTSIKPGELVTGISIPLPKEKWGACYIKLGRYRGEDLAQASVFVSLTKKQCRVGFGSVAPVPRRAQKLEKVLSGQKLDAGLISRVKALVPTEVTPITDVRATKEYRLHMCGVMLERALRAAEARLLGAGPQYGEDLI